MGVFTAAPGEKILKSHYRKLLLSHVFGLFLLATVTITLHNIPLLGSTGHTAFIGVHQLGLSLKMNNPITIFWTCIAQA